MTEADHGICPRCGGVLTIADSGATRSIECERCGARSVEFQAPSAQAIGRGGAATLEVAHTFWRHHPRWFAAQLGFYILSLAVGITGLIIPTAVVAIVGFAVSAILGGVGFLLPPWRDRVVERRISI